MESDKPDGITPFNADGLLLTGITSREQVFLAESENIIQADARHFKRRKNSAKEWMTEGYLRQVHKDMYKHVWAWAGIYRQTDITMAFTYKKHQIVEGVVNLCRDVRFWDQEGPSSMSVLERTARLHHRLTVIHPFPDGNGRHARFVSDLYLFSHRHPKPQWPSIDLMKAGLVRQEYLAALHAADNSDYAPLIFLMRKFSQ